MNGLTDILNYLFNTTPDTTKLDITLLLALGGYTAMRAWINMQKGYLPTLQIFKGRDYAVIPYTGILMLLSALTISAIVNPWWCLLFILFFTAVLGDFVIITILRQYAYIFSAVAIFSSIYLFIRFII